VAGVVGAEDGVDGNIGCTALLGLTKDREERILTASPEQSWSGLPTHGTDRETLSENRAFWSWLWGEGLLLCGPSAEKRSSVSGHQGSVMERGKSVSRVEDKRSWTKPGGPKHDSGGPNSSARNASGALPLIKRLSGDACWVPLSGVRGDTLLRAGAHSAFRTGVPRSSLPLADVRLLLALRC
jgi:hypothetical protein